MNIKKAKERLAAYPDDMACAMALWLPQDVKDYAKERGKIMTDERADEIIQSIDHRHDAGIGITWDVIDGYVSGEPDAPEEEDS
jgi:hypothetical protein